MVHSRIVPSKILRAQAIFMYCTYIVIIICYKMHKVTITRTRSSSGKKGTSKLRNESEKEKLFRAHLIEFKFDTTTYVRLPLSAANTDTSKGCFLDMWILRRHKMHKIKVKNLALLQGKGFFFLNDFGHVTTGTDSNKLQPIGPIFDHFSQQ